MSEERTEVTSVDGGRFTMESGSDGSSLVVRLKGKADQPEAVAALGNLWMAVHARAATQRAKEVSVDLRGLNFMNSSCFRTLVVWLSHLSQTATSEQYNVRFVSDSSKHWQRRSLSALSSFAKELVTLEG